MLIRSATCSLLLFMVVAARSLFAISTDPRLLQLVPPQSRLVAGMSRSAAQGTTGSFLLISAENKVDLSDFFAVTGGDASRRLQALVFVMSGGRDLDENEHSLLVSGQFNRDSIFRFSAAGATKESYRGVPVLVVPPFARQRETFRTVRWLAVPDEHIAIFGSVASVQRELDRWVERSAPDPMLVARMRGLEGRDDSWCVLMAIDRQGIAEKVLNKLDAKLGAVAHDVRLVAYGIKFGRKIEVAITSDLFPADRDVPIGAASGGEMHIFSFLPSEGTGTRIVVKVSRRKYEEWIEEAVPRDPVLAAR